MQAPPAPIVARPEDRFLTAFELNEGHTLNGSNARLHGLRKQAIARFRELGFPPPRTEAWKYTNITRVLQHEYRLNLLPTETGLTPEDLAPYRIPGLDAHTVVLVNGRFAASLSDIGDLPDGAVVTGFARASETHEDLVNRHFGAYARDEQEPFTALNTAFTLDGLFVYVPKGTRLRRPIHLINLIQAEEDLFLQPRLLVVAEPGSQVQLIQTDASRTAVPTFTNGVTEVFVGADAHVRHYLVQDAGEAASAVNTLSVYQEGGSTFTAVTTTLSGATVRNNVYILPDGEHCESNLYGLFLGKNRMHVDNHTMMDHARPHCISNELYKGILDDASTGVFNGKVLVRQDAQQINAYQSNKSIVLSDAAQMYSKPELEIYADDVRCSHGATSGQLDEEAMFYLRARGIPPKEARAMLLIAFARDVLDTIELDVLRTYLDERLDARFHS
ncbi:Fe-S cluster assembly protein SufD [Rhodothermaceae bacterium RA]|nr:Fe-S cluster assembly protein SufD [Rhodothermaceae bacterium RA]